ncbi:MAG: hypothetical protein ACOCQ4_01510 [bacterium]
MEYERTHYKHGAGDKYIINTMEERENFIKSSNLKRVEVKHDWVFEQMNTFQIVVFDKAVMAGFGQVDVDLMFAGCKRNEEQPIKNAKGLQTRFNVIKYWKEKGLRSEKLAEHDIYIYGKLITKTCCYFGKIENGKDYAQILKQRGIDLLDDLIAEYGVNDIEDLIRSYAWVEPNSDACSSLEEYFNTKYVKLFTFVE